MATKCMSCGGSTIKKMKTGGAKPCGPLLCPDGNGSCINCPSGKKAGVIITAIASGMANALGGKKRQANEAAKKAAEEAANTPVAKFTKTLNNKLITKKTGGQTIVGMPRYNATTRPMEMKSGGATKNAKLAAVAPPRNKVTRADVLTRILKKKNK
jgi:hypothetical protein